MGACRDFSNQALLDRRRSVWFSPDVNKDGGYLLLRGTVRQCVNRGSDVFIHILVVLGKHPCSLAAKL